MTKFIEISSPAFEQVRLATANGQPDVFDCHAVVKEHLARVRENESAFHEGRVVILSPEAIAAAINPFDPRNQAGLSATRGAMSGFVQRPMGSQQGGPSSSCGPRDGGTPQGNDCAPVVNCGVTPLGFSTLGNANYPLTGVTVGTITEGSEISVTSGRANRFQALWMYLSARDQGNSFAEIMGFLVSAKINENSQLAGDSLVNRPLVSDLYNQIGPLPLDNWAPISNTAPDVLKMTFGHALGAGVDAQFIGAFFGQAYNA